MIVTAAEAAQKRCTPSLVTLIGKAIMLASGTDSPMSEPFPLTNFACIGPKCMQWHWYDYANSKGTTFRQPQAPAFDRGRADSPAIGPKSDIKYSELPARGYCGLTGARE